MLTVIVPLSRLSALIRSHVRSGTLEIANGVHISAIDRAGPPEFSSTGSLFVMLAQGAKQLAVGDQLHVYRPGDALLAPLDLPTTGRFLDATEAHPSLGFSITLRPDLIAALLLEPAASRLPTYGRRAPAPAGVMVYAAAGELVDAVTRLVALVDRPMDMPVIGPFIQREIHWLLLRGPHGEAVRQLGLADSGLNRVGQAVRWLRTHYAEPVRVEELARMSAMSVSAFHRGFQQITALSPIQFQKQLRLQEARVRLLADSSDVAGVAHEVGYESASQFSRDYRSRFGAPPLTDVRRLRLSAA